MSAASIVIHELGTTGTASIEQLADLVYKTVAHERSIPRLRAVVQLKGAKHEATVSRADGCSSPRHVFGAVAAEMQAQKARGCQLRRDVGIPTPHQRPKPPGGSNNQRLDPIWQ